MERKRIPFGNLLWSSCRENEREGSSDTLGKISPEDDLPATERETIKCPQQWENDTKNTGECMQQGRVYAEV